MSYSPPPQQPPTPQWGQPPVGPPTPPSGRPGWARKRIVIPGAFVILFVGVGIGASGGDDTQTAASTTAAPTVTATVTAQPAKQAAGKVKPAPTVTVTKVATVKPKAEPKPKVEEAPEGKAVFKVWGSAPAGVDITYGSDGENLDGSKIPMTKTLTINDDALYYQINAQLQGGGDVKCSVTIDGKTKTGHARGGYNICSAQLNGGLFGGFS